MTKPNRPQWQDPLINEPPKGCKLHVLTWGGIATEGHWDDKLYAGWNHLAKTPDAIKHRMTLKATGRHKELAEIMSKQNSPT